MVKAVLVPKYPQKCRRPSCGYQWLADLEHPKVCPACKSYIWDRQPKNDGHK